MNGVHCSIRVENPSFGLLIYASALCVTVSGVENIVRSFPVVSLCSTTGYRLTPLRDWALLVVIAATGLSMTDF